VPSFSENCRGWTVLSQSLELTPSEFNRWIQNLQSGEKVVEAVELGEKSNLRGFGPYHQESICRSFRLYGYDLSYRNSPTSQNAYELDRFVLMEHDLVRYAQNPKGISTENGKEDKAKKPRWSSPISEQSRTDNDECPHRYEHRNHERHHDLQAGRQVQLVRQGFFQKVVPF
jgi:hypothetical protein